MRLVGVRHVGIELVRRGAAHRRRRRPVPEPAEIARVRRYGVLSPVPVRQIGPRSWEIVARERDWFVAQRAGVHELPIVVIDGLDDGDLERIAALEDELDPIADAERLRDELDELYRRRGRGAMSALAAASGRSRSWLSHRLALLDLPEPARAAISIGALTGGHGKALLGVRDEAACSRLAIRAIEERWSVRQTEAAVRALRQPEEAEVGQSPAGRPAERVDPDVLALERRVGGVIGSPVSIDVDAGTLTIRYGRSMEVLDGVLERLCPELRV